MRVLIKMGSSVWRASIRYALAGGLTIALTVLTGIGPGFRAWAASPRAQQTQGTQLWGDKFVERENRMPLCARRPKSWAQTWTDQMMFTRVALRDGSVLILRCGDDGVPERHAWICKSSSSEPLATGPLVVPSCLPSATLLDSGNVLIAGGLKRVSRQTMGLKSAEIFNPKTWTFSAVGSMKVGRFFHTGVLLKNGQVLIVGGRNSLTVLGRMGYPPLNDAELFNPVTQTFTETGKSQFAHCCHSARLLRDGRVLVIGDNMVYYKRLRSSFYASREEIYNPATGSFTKVAEHASADRFTPR